MRLPHSTGFNKPNGLEPFFQRKPGQSENPVGYVELYGRLRLRNVMISFRKTLYFN